MLLNTVQWSVLKPFVDETLLALEKSLELKCEADTGFQEKLSDFQFKGYAAVVNTTGSVEGRVLIHHYNETALEVANRIIQKEKPGREVATEMNDDVSNALANLTNEIVKQAISDLASSDSKVDISPAYFVSDTKNLSSIVEGVEEIFSVPIQIEEVGRFYINYLLHKKNS